jgi:hypothetical protein
MIGLWIIQVEIYFDRDHSSLVKTLIKFCEKRTEECGVIPLYRQT